MTTTALFLCDPTDWQRVLIGEYALSQLAGQKEIVIYDFESLGEPLLKSLLRTLGVRSKLKRELLKVLRKQGIRIIYPSLLTIIYSRIECLNNSKLPTYIESDDLQFSNIYPNLVNLTDELKISVSDNSRTVRHERAKSHGILRALSQVDIDGLKLGVLVNGRFTKSLTIRFYFASTDVPLRILEYASTQERYEIFQISPHSNSELGEKIVSTWNSADPEKRGIVAEEFFETLRHRDPSAGINWTSAMIKNSLPEIPRNKKVLTFFSSSEKEFVGVRDEIAENEFKTQASALNAILEIAPGKDWVVYLRRHPKRPDSSGVDVEDAVWEQCRKHDHLIEIDPSSHVDSFALAFESDVVAHYDSSIGPQLINMGHSKVITLSKTSWSSFDEHHNLRTKEVLRSYLNNPGNYLPDVKPWGYFRAIYGNPIENFVLDRTNMTWVVVNPNKSIRTTSSG
jgi:hypothetical protein